MEYRFVHYRQHDLSKEEHNILEAAITLTAGERDDSFLHRVAAFVSEHTQATYVLIGLLSADRSHVCTHAFVKHNEILENISYPLKGTPCDAVFTQRFCYYPTDVREHFPEDEELQELNISSYLGSILVASDSEPVGLIALLDGKPLVNPAFAEHLILVLSLAIEEELSRLKALQC